jgi:predicted ATPase
VSKDYTELQLLRSLVDGTGNAGEGSAEQTVLDILSWLYNQPPGHDAYQQIFDIVAKNHTTTLWDFEENN